MAIILQENQVKVQSQEMTAEQVVADDTAYYKSLQNNWFDGYAILGITIAIFLVGLAARPLLVIATIVIQLAVVFGLIFFLVSHFALI